jgi:hypothetical protein
LDEFITHHADVPFNHEEERMKRKNGFIAPKLMLLCALMTTVNALDEIPDDMSKWSDQGTVLRKGGGWDSHDAWFVENVIKSDRKYYLYWIGGQKSCWHDGGGYSCVGLATSTDGKNFTKHSGNPVIRPEQASYVSSWEHGCRNAHSAAMMMANSLPALQ